MALLKESSHPNVDGFCPMVLRGRIYTEKKEAGAAIIELCRAMTSPDTVQIGQYRGFTMELYLTRWCVITGSRSSMTSGTSPPSARISTATSSALTTCWTASLPTNLNACQAQLENTKDQMEIAKVQVEKLFHYEEEFQTKFARLAELNSTRRISLLSTDDLCISFLPDAEVQKNRKMIDRDVVVV